MRTRGPGSSHDRCHACSDCSVWKVFEDGGAVLHLRGDIDDLTVLSYETSSPVPSAGGQGYGAVGAVDASAVTFMDAAGLGFLLRETAPLVATGRRPVLRRPSGPVRLILELTGLSGVFASQ